MRQHVWWSAHLYHCHSVVCNIFWINLTTKHYLLKSLDMGTLIHTTFQTSPVYLLSDTGYWKCHFLVHIDYLLQISTSYLPTCRCCVSIFLLLIHLYFFFSFQGMVCGWVGNWERLCMLHVNVSLCCLILYVRYFMFCVGPFRNGMVHLKGLSIKYNCSFVLKSLHTKIFIKMKCLL